MSFDFRLMFLCFVMTVRDAIGVVYGREMESEIRTREYPYAISIMRHSRVHCGGILIKPEWTLTACSCIGMFKMNGSTVKFIRYKVNSIVLVGGSISNVVTTNNYENVQIRRAGLSVWHPQCSHDGHVWGQDYGAFLSDKFEITRVLRPAKLHSEERLREMILLWVSLEAACKTIGWGATVINFTTQYFKPSNILKVADVHLMDWGECGLKLCQQPLSICDEKIYKLGKLCAMNINGSDSCDKDEGGALICGGGWIVGFASKSSTCGEYLKPRLYSSFLDGYWWIQSLLDGSLLMTSPAAVAGSNSFTFISFILLIDHFMVHL